MAVAFALPSAVTFGVGEFTGGLATRRNPAVLVTALSQVTGLVVLLPLLGLLPGSPSAAASGWGALGGLAGALGLGLYFCGLAVGPMGVVAPLSSLTAAGLPVVAGLLGGERPGPGGAVAAALALVAVGLATAGTTDDGPARTGVLLGLGSGAAFGLFFIALDATPDGSGAWPLLAARTASILVLGGLLLAGIGRVRPVEPGLIALSGAMDMTANVLFLLATRAGTLTLTAVVVSLYPVVVVVLARLVLGERLGPARSAGVVLALGATALLSVSA